MVEYFCIKYLDSWNVDYMCSLPVISLLKMGFSINLKLHKLVDDYRIPAMKSHTTVVPIFRCRYTYLNLLIEHALQHDKY